MPSAFNAFPTSRPLPPDDIDAAVSDSEPETSDSEDVTEDEDGVELTPALDAAIMRTLGMIRRKEGVYGDEQVLQEQLKKSAEKAQGLHLPEPKTREKPFRLQDHHRAHLLSTVAKPSANDMGEAEPLTNVQSERLLRQEALDAFKSFGADESEGEEEDGFLQKRVKTENELKEEEAAYRQFLLESGGGEDEVRRALGLQPKTSTDDVAASDDASDSDDGEVIDGQEGSAPTEPTSMPAEKRTKKPKQSDDDFLMNYILNRGWIDRSEEEVPTYDEIVAAKPKPAVAAAPAAGPWGTLDEDEDFEEKAEEFETAYNFRFEEPGAAHITSHPRQIATLVRRPDDARKTKRAARAERKAAEKAQQEEKTRALKGSKRREMERQIEVLKKETSAKGADWSKIEEMLEGEWDEAKFESALQGIYEADGEDDEKPTWDDDDDEGLGAVDAEAADYPDMDDEDAPINMDADFIAVEESSKAKKRRDRKGKGRAEPVSEVPEDAGLTVKEKAAKVKDAMEEYRKLDHEDMIGDLPTRFKYTPSAKTAYGLTPAEILLATDAELNSLVGVKHLAPYRHGGLGTAGKGMGQRVRALKETLAARKWGEEFPDERAGAKTQSRQRDSGYASRQGDGEKKAGKRKGKKERSRVKLAEGGEGGAEDTASAAPAAAAPVKRKADEAPAAASPAINTAPADSEGRKRKRKKKAHTAQ